MFGGPEKSFVTLSAGLAAHDHEAIVACSENLKPHFCDNGVRTFPLWIGPKLSRRNVHQLLLLPLMFFYFLGLFIYLKRKEKIDVVYMAYKKEQMIGAMAARLLGLSVIWREEGPLASPIPESKIWRTIYRTLASITHRVVASCAAAESSLFAIGVKPEKVTVVYNGIDLERFAKKRRMPRQPTIGIVARLSGFKGHDLLIRAMKQVVRKFPDARLLIIGDGPEKANLQKLVSQLQLSRQVEFIGFVNDVSSYLEQLNVFVLPSQAEGLPFSIIEAMAKGIPVVATRTGGVPELVLDGQTGLILDEATPDAIAGAITKLLEDKKLAQKMGAAARRRSRELFSVHPMVTQMETIIKEAVTRSAKL